MPTDISKTGLEALLKDKERKDEKYIDQGIEDVEEHRNREVPTDISKPGIGLLLKDIERKKYMLICRKQGTGTC